MSAETEASFSWPVRVYHEDTDFGGVVYYANYLRFMERARTEWLRSIGIDQNRVRDELGLLFVVVSCNVQYLRPARFNDALEVTVTISDYGRASLTFEQQVLRGDEQLCTGVVRAASVAAGTLKPVALPSGVHEALNG